MRNKANLSTSYLITIDEVKVMLCCYASEMQKVFSCECLIFYCCGFFWRIILLITLIMGLNCVCDNLQISSVVDGTRNIWCGCVLCWLHFRKRIFVFRATYHRLRKRDSQQQLYCLLSQNYWGFLFRHKYSLHSYFYLTLSDSWVKGNSWLYLKFCQCKQK